MSSTPDYHAMLEIALEEARQGLSEGGIPIGAALFHKDGRLLGRGHNRRVQDGDPSVHGETDAFRKAGRQRSYKDTIMVTTFTSKPPRLTFLLSGRLVELFDKTTLTLAVGSLSEGGVALERHICTMRD